MSNKDNEFTVTKEMIIKYVQDQLMTDSEYAEAIAEYIVNEAAKDDPRIEKGMTMVLPF